MSYPRWGKNKRLQPRDKRLSEDFFDDRQSADPVLQSHHDRLGIFAPGEIEGPLGRRHSSSIAVAREKRFGPKIKVRFYDLVELRNVKTATGL